MIIFYWLWLFGTWVTGLVPPSVARRVARLIGTLGYYLILPKQQIARANFAHVLGRSENDAYVRRVARRAMANYIEYLYDMLYYPHMSKEEICARVCLDGYAPVDATLKHQGPIIIVSGHFGHMDWAGVAAAQKFRPFTLAAETVKPVQVFEYLAQVRARHGLRLAPYDTAPRKIIEALRNNEFVAFMLDFGFRKHIDIPFVLVNFFGAWTRFTATPALLARRYHAPILLAFPYVDAKRNVQIKAVGPFWVPENLPREEAARVTMQEIARGMEPILAQHAEQWYVFREIWPRPSEAAELEQQLVTEAISPSA